MQPCVRLSHGIPLAYILSFMTIFHVTAAAGDSAEDLRSLGLFEAVSAEDALKLCLPQLDRDPVLEVQGVLPDVEDVAELIRRERRQLRDALAEPDVSFIVVPTEAQAHFVRDLDGVFKPPEEVDCKRARIRRDFGVDIV